MKTILSGIQPSGRPHIGNYFGMMKQMIDLQKDNLVYAIIVDYHALNSTQDAETLRENTRNVVIDYLALGFDPDKGVLFKQSDIPEHTELCWIFNTITTVPYLKRGHAYKDAVAKGGEEDVSVGKFDYPMLMAADMLLYNPDLIPVGQDQKQHIEFARDTAEKFNRVFKTETFKLPEQYILDNVQTVPGIDGQKMSKSYNNTIPLFASDEEIEKAVMSIVTDSSGDYPENVFKIHQLFRPNDYLDKLYEENKGKYKILKEALIEDIKNFIGPLRAKREEIANPPAGGPDLVNEVLEKGKARASEVARAKMSEVKLAIGVA